jgi:hypothetical protein
MAERGFQYTKVPYPPRGEVLDALGLVPEIPEDSTIQEKGYLAFVDAPMPPPSAWTLATSENEARAQLQDWMAAYAGDDAKNDVGCRLSANRSVVDDAGLVADSLYQPLSEPIIPILVVPMAYESSSELRADITAWSTCMAEKGFEYASPIDVGASIPSTPDGVPTPTEILTATADVHCRTETGYQDALLHAFGDLARSWLSEHEGEVVALRQATEADIEALNTLLNAERPPE